MSLRVLEPGLMSLLVDAGRPRWRSLGVPLGGAADRAALALGNALVGNDTSTVALEITLSGPVLEALDPTAGVVFGAPFVVSVNDRSVEPGATFTLHRGDVVRVGGTAAGVRGYLCVAGGFDSAEVLGSRSALEPVRKGDVLTCRTSRTGPRALPFAAIDRHSTLRALPGPQRDWFAADAFFARPFNVSPASNRMGVRLKGEPLSRTPGELTSEAVAPGAVQVTNDGLPVVLGVDGQTIGGYPKVAHVIRADLDALAQLRPGDEVLFEHISVEDAEAAARARAAFLDFWLTRLRLAERRPTFD